ncbi:MAG: amidohydrolase family protein [Acidimicrobiia bacterium]|nr:amidohydrolase family protein [Acidimicrobiia bacterium]
MDYDLRIVGGTVIDGSGGPRRRGDVGIRGGRIVALGDAPGTAKQTIEAEGRVVAPGFVDIHTHYDAQIFWDRMLTISPWHGVTTVVMGNCGFGVAPTRRAHRDLILRTLEKVEGMSLEALQAGLGAEWPFETFPEYLDAIETAGTAINAAALVGHTPVRMYVMGEESTERPATEGEIGQMRQIVREALGAGALGFATSKSTTHVGYEGRPVPSRLAELDEIRALAAPLAEFEHGVMQATVGRGLFFDEFATLARETGCPVSWTALLAGMMGPGSHRGLLGRSAQIVKEGIPVYPQVACRPLNFEFNLREPFIFESMSLFQPVSAADFDGKCRIYGDAEFRAKLREKAGPGSEGNFGRRWADTMIAWCPSDRSLEERPLLEVARERGIDPIDLLCDLSLTDRLETRFRMAVVNTDEDEVEELLTHPDTVLGLSDAGAHASQLCDACFSTHLLSRWVREREALTLERAVHMLTARPAKIFGIRDRGLLAEGRPADVVVFDPATVGAGPLQRVSDLPGGADRLVSEAFGIDAVIVNGAVLRRNGADVLTPGDPLPGRLLRRGHAD